MNSEIDRQINELRLQVSNLAQLVAKLIIDVETLKSQVDAIDSGRRRR